MLTNLFGEIETYGLTIEQAARTASVSTATIRNWIKTGYLVQLSKGSIELASFDNFMSNIAGTEKLNTRANKTKKDEHDHQELSTKINSIVQKFSGENIGTAYENSLSDSYRNKEGIYYTPTWVVRDMLKNIKVSRELTFLDPCCGSGNFLIEAIKAGIAPENVYGFDIDENAVFMAKERVKQEFGIENPHIRVGDFLQEAHKLSSKNQAFDLIFTNPPWGKKIDKEEKERFASIYGCGNSLDTTSLFMGASLSLLKPNGFLGFLVQEAFFNITTFEGIRNKSATKKIVRFVDYGKAFNGLVTKAQAIVLENTEPNLDDKIECCLDNHSFTRDLKSFKNNPKLIFNFWTDENEAQVIDRLYSETHITLQGKAKWALGIVTGNNERFCRNTQEEGYIPIYKGSDITKTGLKKPKTFILNDFSNFQQVAPLEMYQAKEKLIYKFISSDLCFYCDTHQRYILNSANLLIPLNIGITGKQLGDLLNSEIMNWLFKKLFSTHKVLRGDLEMLPIHTGYFSVHQEFSELNYLNYLRITKENGTFRIKDFHIKQDNVKLLTPYELHGDNLEQAIREAAGRK
jgi:site-specific DNA-methyltransferase (adenine-specific)